MPLSSVMGAAQTNINSNNIQLYGGRKVFVDVNAFRGDISGMMAANREYNTYLSGLAHLTGAGAQMLDKFWGALLETQARDTETALSKAYRDTFTEMATDEKYQGKNALNLSSDFLVKKKEIYDRFREDNPDVNKRILNNIDAQLQNRYYDRIGALQTDRIAQWNTQSKLNNMAETVDSAALSQLGDFNALADIYNKSKELFGNDPVRGRKLANEGLTTVLQSWAGRSPAAFMSWSQANKGKVVQMFGGATAKDIDSIFVHAQARVRSDISFANSQAAHARQMQLFQRQEDSYNASRYMQRQLAEHPDQPISINQPIPELGNRALVDVMDFGKMSGIFAFARQQGSTAAVAEMAGSRGKDAEVFTYISDPTIPMADKQKQFAEWLKDGTFSNREQANAALDRAAQVAKLTNKMEADKKTAELWDRANHGDEKVLDEYLVLMQAGHGSITEYNQLKRAYDDATQTIPILGKDVYNMYLDYAKDLIAPARDIVGNLKGGAPRSLFNSFRQEYNDLGRRLVKQYGGNLEKVRAEMRLDGKTDNEANRLLQATLAKRAGYGAAYNAINPRGVGDWMNTGTSGGGRYKQTVLPQTAKYVLPHLGTALPESNPKATNHDMTAGQMTGVAEPPIANKRK